MALGRKFDVVLLASGLINHPSGRVREALLDAAGRHLRPGGRFLCRSQNSQWLRTAEVGPVGTSAVSSGLSAHGSWEHILWLVASLFIVAVVPVTLPVIFPTNNSLLAPGRDLASPETRALLVKWGRLHAIRSALSLVAAVLFVGLLVAARPFHRAAIRLRAVRSGRVQGAEK